MMASPFDGRCSACPAREGVQCTKVFSVGPEPCSVLMLGAGPSKVENATGIPYTGLAGDELNGLYLPLANLIRIGVHIGNVTMCWDGTDRQPPDKRIQACANAHLTNLIYRVQPDVIVLMGAAACSIVDSSKVRLDMHHGRPLYASLLQGTYVGWIWASFEPALGMRDTGRMTHLMQDFRHLGQWLKGTWQPPSSVGPATRRTNYTLLHEQIAGLHPVLAVDTESHANRPWSMQWSGAPGSGYMLRSNDAIGLAKFQEWLRETDPELIFHHANEDIKRLEQMGIRHNWRWRDTLQEAFHLCDQPQGLKQLVYRNYGYEMKSWEDTVWPASVDAMCYWLTLVELHAKEDLAGVRRKKTKKVLYEPYPSAVEQIAHHIIQQTRKPRAADADPYDPWEAFKEMRTDGLRNRKAEEWEWESVALNCGAMPELGIANCQEVEARDYAVGDADWTGIVARDFSNERIIRTCGNGRWNVPQMDWDK